MILRLTKQFDFQMAHSLTGYDGKCSNIHGHNYRLLVTVEGEPIASADNAKNGMVMDFGDIKQIVAKHLIEPFDHALVVQKDSPYSSIEGTKLIVTSFQPTSENMLIHFASLLGPHMPPTVALHSLRLYETESSYAELIL